MIYLIPFSGGKDSVSALHMTLEKMTDDDDVWPLYFKNKQVGEGKIAIESAMAYQVLERIRDTHGDKLGELTCWDIDMCEYEQSGSVDVKFQPLMWLNGILNVIGRSQHIRVGDEVAIVLGYNKDDIDGWKNSLESVVKMFYNAVIVATESDIAVSVLTPIKDFTDETCYKIGHEIYPDGLWTCEMPEVFEMKNIDGDEEKVYAEPCGKCKKCKKYKEFGWKPTFPFVVNKFKKD